MAVLAAATAIAAAAAIAAATAAPLATTTIKPLAKVTAPPLVTVTVTAMPVPDAVVAKYASALKAVKEPRVFSVEYTIEQTGTRSLEQTHRIFRSGADERDETIAVNGSRPAVPLVRIFRRRPYRYTIAALAPKPSAYDFTYAGPHKSGKHVDYVFDVTPKKDTPSFAFTQVTIDGVTFLPSAVSFVTNQHAGSGRVTFAKSDRWWVARTAAAQANVPGGIAHERLNFSRWRFPATLPQSTFSPPRPLLTPPPATP
jgi:hypothetical protein